MNAPTPFASPNPSASPVWFAVAALGLEQVVHDELRALAPTLSLVPVPGGVEFAATAHEARRLLPALRVATRLWRRLGHTRARAFGEWQRKCAAWPWAQFVRPGQLVRVDVSVQRCKLYHSKALQQRLVEALAESLGGPVRMAEPQDDDAASAEPAHEEPLRILVRGQSDEFFVSVDASGERLHRRGYRQEVGKAPLRETLAAGLLALCGWTPAEPLVDPMCGSGTLPIEAALQALGHATPRQRFAMDEWPCREGVPLPHLAAPASPEQPLRIWGFDKDPVMVGRAQRNAERAGVASHITWKAQRFDTTAACEEPGLLLFNPPYGHRLARGHMPASAWRELEATIAGWHSWRVGVLVPKGAALQGQGLQIDGRHSLRNGGLAVELVRLRVPARFAAK